MKEGRQTVVICGFGELGQTIANMLEVCCTGPNVNVAASLQGQVLVRQTESLATFLTLFSCRARLRCRQEPHLHSILASTCSWSAFRCTHEHAVDRLQSGVQ
jgi:hypothetical protein